MPRKPTIKQKQTELMEKLVKTADNFLSNDKMNPTPFNFEPPKPARFSSPSAEVITDKVEFILNLLNDLTITEAVTVVNVVEQYVHSQQNSYRYSYMPLPAKS